MCGDGVGFLWVVDVGAVRFGVTLDCFGTGSSADLESNEKNSSQLLSTTLAPRKSAGRT
jgi:hypothetical protein